MGISESHNESETIRCLRINKHLVSKRAKQSPERTGSHPESKQLTSKRWEEPVQYELMLPAPIVLAISLFASSKSPRR